MDGEVLGNPIQEEQYWGHQSHQDDCQEMAMADIVGQLTGHEPSEAEMVSLTEQMASASHPGDVYVPGQGTSTQDAVEVFSHYGITSTYSDDQGGTVSSDQCLQSLESALSNGGKPLVSVDAPMIWDSLGIAHQLDPGQPDHAVVVTGIDTSTNTVYLNDSGVGDTDGQHGAGEAVPLDVFMQSWATSGHEMVVADPVQQADTNPPAILEVQHMTGPTDIPVPSIPIPPIQGPVHFVERAVEWPFESPTHTVEALGLAAAGGVAASSLSAWSKKQAPNKPTQPAKEAGS
jgi:hypothetical protein